MPKMTLEDRNMKIGLGRTAHGVIIAVCVALIAGVASAATPQTAPYVKKFKWGTFKLSPRVATKLQQKKTLNVVLSVNGTATPVYGPQYAYGFPLGIAAASKKYKLPLKGKIIGPVQSNPAEQINQLLSSIKSKQIDCLGLTVSDAGFAPVINAAVKAGIPVFTTGADEPKSRRFSAFQTDWTFEGKVAARETVAFFKAKGIPLKTAALTSGGAATVFAQTRMKAYYSELKKLVPDIKFLNTPENALDTTFDPAATYSAVRAFLQGNQDVQALYQTDIAGGVLDKAVNDVGLKGKTFVIGHNVDLSNLAGIADGTQIATLDQNYLAQSQFPALACAAYLKNGKVLPNTNVPAVIKASNVDAAKATFIKTTQPKK
jgi:ABC-type sugar transport system substrate-binding protein